MSGVITQGDFDNSVYWLRSQGASDPLIDVLCKIGEQYGCLPDEAAMRFLNAMIEKKAEAIAAVVNAACLVAAFPCSEDSDSP